MITRGIATKPLTCTSPSARPRVRSAAVRPGAVAIAAAVSVAVMVKKAVGVKVVRTAPVVASGVVRVRAVLTRVSVASGAKAGGIVPLATVRARLVRKGIVPMLIVPMPTARTLTAPMGTVRVMNGLLVRIVRLVIVRAAIMVPLAIKVVVTSNGVNSAGTAMRRPVVVIARKAIVSRRAANESLRTQTASPMQPVKTVPARVVAGAVRNAGLAVATQPNRSV